MCTKKFYNLFSRNVVHGTGRQIFRKHGFVNIMSFYMNLQTFFNEVIKTHMKVNSEICINIS